MIDEYITRQEAEKYANVWTHAEYRKHSPAVAALDRIQDNLLLRPYQAATTSIIDFGCGSGAAMEYLARKGFIMRGVDIAANVSMVPKDSWGTLNMTWRQGAIHEMPRVPLAEYGYCIDVMEHIPTAAVKDTLETISCCVKDKVYFEIAGYPDKFGPKLIGEPLHLTILKQREWMDLMYAYWDHVTGWPVPECKDTFAFVCFGSVCHRKK